MTSPSPDVVIVGGGIAGAATAYYLARAGLRCTIIERDGLASHASGFAYGGLSGGIPNGPGANTPVMLLGMRLHRELASSLAEEAGMDIQFGDRPLLRVALNEAEEAALRSDWEWKTSQEGYDVEWLDGEGARKLEPRITPEAIGALHVEGSSDVEPYRLTLALAQAAERKGVEIRTGTVSGLHHHGGRVRGVVLESGEISCDKVVLAMGPWSGDVEAWTGAPLPVRPLKGQIIRLRAPGAPYRYSIGHGKDYAMTKQSDGLVWCGTTEEPDAGFDESITTEGRDSIIDSTMRMLPSLADAELVLQTACLRPVTPDGAIVVGPAPRMNGVFIATGAGRQGIVMGPAMGRIAADLVLGEPPEIAIDAYDPGRFA